eukprot:12895655-Prorocentrum_lima.AAC.1
MDSVPPTVKEVDSILSFILLTSLPEKMKGRVFEETEWAMGLPRYILCGMMLHQGDRRNCRA